MPRLSTPQLRNILDAFQESGVTVSDFIVSVLCSRDDVVDEAIENIGNNLVNILLVFHENPRVHDSMSASIHRLAKTMYMSELASVSKKEAGMHFNAHWATEADLEGFELVGLVEKLTSLAPHVCDLVDGLLSADPVLTRRRHKRRRKRCRAKRREREAREHPCPANLVTAPDIVSSNSAVAEDNVPKNRPSDSPVDSDAGLWAQLPQFPQEEDPAPGPAEEYWSELLDMDVDFDMLDVEEYDDEEDVGGDDNGEVDDDDDGDDNGEGNDEDEYFDGLEPLLEDPDDPESMMDPYMEEEHYEAILKMKRTLCMSLMMQSTNQRSNALQSVIGLYLHSCNAPEAVVDLLARIGVAISRTAIDDAITNLSKESAAAMKRLGCTMLTSIAYDNFDVELKHVVPTAEKPHDSLLHMTSGTFIPLDHGATLGDLQCSDDLWKESPYNPESTKGAEEIDWKELLTLYPQNSHPSGLDCRERFNTWVFKHDLFVHGPEYFRQFLAKLDEPDAIDHIPLVKSRKVPAEAMDINQSSVQGNIEALNTLFKQAGIGDPTDLDDEEQAHRHDVGDHVVLVHGDLATCERVQSLRQSRGEEKTAFRRFQLVIFIIGLFHLKMACVDAIWKIFIYPKLARQDETSLMKQAAEIRPKETGKIGSKPGFRRMHEIVQHVGAVSRLDCWREEVSLRDPSFTSLDAWAKSAPSMDDIEEIANVLVKKYVANTDMSERYFLLYEELAWSMNVGDIGRVEDCFMPSVFIFKGCGKHKYATQMVRFVHDLHFVYPAKLRQVIRMNILCNPTGKKNHFRAIDWWVEHNNLYIKQIYGGQFSNRTKCHIMKESALVEVFKNIRISLEDMFALEHRTYKHSPPKLQHTFRKLARYMQNTKTHSMIAGRTSSYTMVDASETGLLKMVTSGWNSGDDGVTGPTADVAVEDEPEINADGGDLDV
ncbi:uncharacterized protein B0H18DRAFT_1128681 [Fomitopsis serialis]|uniref:uncharacterized protein n=1 Tax=Fomitopsis serialis TaxID=139415 RepID=UPI00200895CE|nr:uncharacterized protein B0H18DRAFT_1128681 [Neoantrodia serialis]KAH9911456.1 hypothetical protein B0H18DRAFT_1128681 [Neoantrodia serialis]